MSDDIKRELYRVSEDFAQLCRLREIMQSEGEDTAPIETAIREYISADVTREKIDGVIGYIRYCESMEDAALKELSRLSKLAASWKTQREWLKDCAKSVLESSGQKRLEGKTAGYIGLRKNGGAAPVTITNADLIPEELVQYEGRISGKAWAELSELGLESTTLCFSDWRERQDVQMERIPHKGRIAEALAAKCEQCLGIGAVAVSPQLGAQSETENCPACDGTGHAKVPGAHLGDRGQHVEIR